MSLSSLPLELILKIFSYLSEELHRGFGCILFRAFVRPYFPSLKTLHSISLVNHRLSAAATLALYDIATSEARSYGTFRYYNVYKRGFVPRRDPSVICHTHFPTSIILAVRAGNLKLAQELLRLVPAGVFPPKPMVPDTSPDWYAKWDPPRHGRYYEYPPRPHFSVCQTTHRDAILATAIRGGHVELARWLLDNLHLMGGGVPHPFAAPVAAVMSGNIDMLELVWERCDPSYRGRCVLRQAVQQDDVAMVRRVLELLGGVAGEVATMPYGICGWYSYQSISVFEWACSRCNIEIVKLLVEYDTAGEAQREKRMCYVTDYNNWISELQYSDDPDAPEDDRMLIRWSRTMGTWSPLYNLVVRGADIELLEAVLAKAPEEVQTRGRTKMLYWAASKSRTKIARWLVDDLKVDVKAQNYEESGQTPLHIANNLEMVKLLMDADADPISPPNNKGKLPIERFLALPHFLEVVLPYIKDRSSPDGKLNAFLRSDRAVKPPYKSALPRINQWLARSEKVLLSAGVSMAGLEEHIEALRKKEGEEQAKMKLGSETLESGEEYGGFGEWIDE